MSFIWTLFLVISILCAAAGGTGSVLAPAAMAGARSGVELAISIAGPLCLWSGLAKVMSAAGLSDKLSRLLSPLLSRLYPRVWTDREGREALCGNITANLLGLGNAATPLGIRAVHRMARQQVHDGASDEMCRLVVMNTASIQLIPTTVAALRAGLGCTAPFDILPAVWITSLCSVAAGLIAAKVLSRWL